MRQGGARPGKCYFVLKWGKIGHKIPCKGAYDLCELYSVFLWQIILSKSEICRVISKPRVGNNIRLPALWTVLSTSHWPKLIRRSFQLFSSAHSRYYCMGLCIFENYLSTVRFSCSLETLYTKPELSCCHLAPFLYFNNHWFESHTSPVTIMVTVCCMLPSVPQMLLYAIKRTASHCCMLSRFCVRVFFWQ